MVEVVVVVVAALVELIPSVLVVGIDPAVEVTSPLVVVALSPWVVAGAPEHATTTKIRPTVPSDAPRG